MSSEQRQFVANLARQSRSCRESAIPDWPRSIGSPRAWHAALTFLLTHLGRSAAAFAAELQARHAINHLRSLDDDRLRDLGLERKDIERLVRFGRD